MDFGVRCVVERGWRAAHWIEKLRKSLTTKRYALNEWFKSHDNEKWKASMSFTQLNKSSLISYTLLTKCMRYRWRWRMIVMCTGNIIDQTSIVRCFVYITRKPSAVNASHTGAPLAVKLVCIHRMKRHRQLAKHRILFFSHKNFILLSETCTTHIGRWMSCLCRRLAWIP